MQDLAASATQISTTLSDGRSLLNSYVDKIVAVINAGFALPLASLGTAVILYLVRCKPGHYSVFIYVVTTLTSVFIWLSFGFSMPFAVFARQACDVELRNNPQVRAHLPSPSALCLRLRV
jgi:hypothetical protein